MDFGRQSFSMTYLERRVSLIRTRVNTHTVSTHVKLITEGREVSAPPGQQQHLVDGPERDVSAAWFGGLARRRRGRVHIGVGERLRTKVKGFEEVRGKKRLDHGFQTSRNRNRLWWQATPKGSSEASPEPLSCIIAVTESRNWLPLLLFLPV